MKRVVGSDCGNDNDDWDDWWGTSKKIDASVREDRNSWLIIAKWSSRPRDLQTLLSRSLAWRIVLWRQVQCLCKTIDKGQFQCIADDGLPFTFGSCAFRFANAGAGAACRHSLTIQDFSYIPHMFLFLFQLAMVSVPKGLLDWFILEFGPTQAKKAHNCYPYNMTKKSGQPICLMKLKTSTRVYENWATTFPQCTN